MPAFYRYLGFGFIAVLLVIAGAMIGAVLYELHISTAAPDDFWSRWQAIIGSFGVLAAIGVAIYTDVKVDRRFEAQIETQTALDRRADERQQDEWQRRENDTSQQKEALAARERERLKAVVQGLILELDNIAFDLRPIAAQANGNPDFAQIDVLLETRATKPTRPIYDNLGQTICGLPPMIISAISRHQSAYQQAYDEYVKFLGVDRPGRETFEKMSAKAKKLRSITVGYLDNLQEAFGAEFP